MAAPTIRPSGFREYDGRWRFPEEIDLPGLQALGLGVAAQMRRRGLAAEIVVGHDFRRYSPRAVKALIHGLVAGGLRVRDIGLALTPMAYFAQIHLGSPAIAMLTASHNPNGWTGLKIGFAPPLTHGPEEMAELRAIVLGPSPPPHPGGIRERVAGLRAAYLDDVAGGLRMRRRLRVVCATGNGTAGAFAPALLERIGVEVIHLHTALDPNFPHYNPNPESLAMLEDMAAAARRFGADLALGFDGDGDRCGVVDHTGREIFADKMGLIIARDLAPRHPGAHLVVDVKSTGLFGVDPVLRRHRITTEYWKTGHSHMKRRVRERQALAGFEKSGHFVFAPPLGRGYDCGLRAAGEICALLDRNPCHTLAELADALPRSWASPTMSPFCPDERKYLVAERIAGRLARLAREEGSLAGQRIVRVLRVNGARVELEGGDWGLVRASSNTPNLVVACESFRSHQALLSIFEALDALIRSEPGVGPYDQSLPAAPS